MNEIIWGKNAINEALKSGRIIKACVLKDSPYIAIFERQAIEYKIVNKNYLDRLSNFQNHQGVLAYIKAYELADIESMIKKENGLIIVLDGLKDPHNLGAILRTADCVGADGVIYKKHNSVKLNATVAKVSSGAIEYVKVAEVNNLVNTLKILKKKGYWIVGTAADAPISYTELKYDMNTVLVIGSEGEGMSRLVKEECDFLISLPMKGHVDSLNASVAAGILMYRILADRQK